MPARKTILVAEDDTNDVFLLKMAFQKAGIDVHMEVVTDGEEAIAYLKKKSQETLDPIPELLLLDLKMPRVNGFEVLEWIRHQPRLKRMLTIVMTSSDEPRDINLAYDLGANSYLVKPGDLTDLVTLARHLHDYWMNINRHPDYA